MKLDAVIETLFLIAKGFINDDGLAFASTVFSLVLVFHALLGAGELVMGKDCRFINPNFWFRILFFGALIASFDTLILPFAETVAKLGFDGFLTAYTDSWKAWTTVSSKVAANAGSQDSAWNAFFSPGSLITGALMSAVGTLLAFIIGGLLILLTFVMGLVGVGLSTAVCCMAPIALVFGTHEATEGIALNYLKAFLVYCVFYMPMLALSMQIALTLMVGVNSVSLDFSYATSAGGFIEHIFLIVTAPLASFALVFTVPMTASNILK